jgi:hypothetical protein
MLVGAVGVIFLLGISLFSATGPEANAKAFMSALAAGDAETLTRLSSSKGMRPETLLDQWKFTTGTAAKYFSFRWSFDAITSERDDTATVKFSILHFVGQYGSQTDKFELPMVREDGQWKVAVNQLSRNLFPGLPR